MPTLLQINTTLNSGSTGRITEQISLMAQRRGWDCYIAHGGRYVNKSQFKSIQISAKTDNIFHAIKGEFLGRHGFGSTRSTKKFLNQIDKIQPDIVHFHNLHGYYLNIEILLSYLSKKNIPIVWTLHDCWAITGHCTHFENYGCYKWKTQCEKCPLLMAQYKSRLFDRSKKNYQKKKELYLSLGNLTLVPVSYWLGGIIRESILGGHSIKVIRNGIDLDSFKPTDNNVRSKLNIPYDKKIILGVVASGFKGKKEFIELTKNVRYQVVVVGVNKEWMKGLPNNIICVERTNNQQELAEYYSSADVFVNPTYDDTFPTTNLEAQACGTPVVTYKAGGSPETIDENTGIAVERGDFTALQNAIEEIIINGKNHYSIACRERAEKYFNKDERFMDYVFLYEELVRNQLDK